MFKLASYIVREGALDPEDAVGWVVRLSLALEILHRVGAAHGRISAKAIQALGPSCHAAGFFLDTGDLLDDVAYHSPERIKGAGISPEDDTWATGVLLYRGLTGTLPFPGTSPQQVAGRLLAGPPPSLSSFRIDHVRLQQVVDAVLSRSSGGRLTSIVDLRHRLIACYPLCEELQALKLGKPEIGVLADEATDAEGQKLTDIMSKAEVHEQIRVALAKRDAQRLRGAEARPSDPDIVLPQSPFPPSLAPPESEDTTLRRDSTAIAMAAVEEADSLAETRRVDDAAAVLPPTRRAAPAPQRSSSYDLLDDVVVKPFRPRLALGKVVVVTGLLTAAAVGAFLHLRPADEEPSAGAASARSSATATGAGNRSAVTTTGGSTASATTRASAAPPQRASMADLTACMLPLFPKDTFAWQKPDFGRLCSETNARKGGNAIRVQVIRAGSNDVTDGMREWGQLGWYEMPAFALARALCCADSPALKTPSGAPGCQLDESLSRFGAVALGSDEAAIDRALGEYKTAVMCLIRKGAAGSFGQRRLPGAGARAVFEMTLERARRAQPK